MKFVDNKNIITNIFRIQVYDSIMCGYFCIGFISFMFNRSILADFTNLFSLNDFKKNDNIILNYFSNYSLKWLDAILLNEIRLSTTLLRDLTYIQI